jgi:hypothetical protein
MPTRFHKRQIRMIEIAPGVNRANVGVANSAELAVIVRHLMQRFASPDEARELLQAQQSSGEALMPTRFHKRQIRMIEIAPGVNRANVGVANKQSIP